MATKKTKTKLKAKRRRRRKHSSIEHRHTNVGAAPGALSVDPEAPPGKIRVIGYTQDNVFEKNDVTVTELEALRKEWPLIWVDVVGLGDVALIQSIGDIFALHPLALEDTVHTHQRAKVEPYPGSLYVAMRMATNADTVHLDLEQVSLFLGEGFVVTFQEREGDCFEPVRDRIRASGGRVRGGTTDYLAYTLLDAIVDSYFPLLEGYGDRLEDIEALILSDPEPSVLQSIHEIKRDLLGIRRATWPMREAMSSLLRDPHPIISDDTRLYLRDCYDHSIQILDLLENQRELTAGLMDVYLSTVSNRMNEVMKVLTIIATIFMPLGFVAGLYGMNFDHARSPLNMPELGWYYGYPFVLGIMASMVIGMLAYFRRKRWI